VVSLKCDKRIRLFNLLQFWVYNSFFVKELKLRVDEHPLSEECCDFEINLVTDYTVFKYDLERLKKLIEEHGFSLERFDFEVSSADGNILLEIRGVAKERGGGKRG